MFSDTEKMWLQSVEQVKCGLRKHTKNFKL